ncbi:MAG: KaiA-binding protein, partial [Ktedonobacterales bacterium]|nr:KaiA-binding protein [Ktedonobacterales bacterium]
AAGERVTYLSFRETRDQLGRVTEAFTLGDQFHEALASGRLNLLTLPPIKVNPDIIADRLLAMLDDTHAQRLIIDSIAEIEEAITASQAPGRLRDYLAALTSAFQARGLTTLLIKETIRAVAPTLDFSAEPLAMMAENVMLAQQVTYQGQLHRILSILKLRYSGHDTALREFTIDAPAGICVLADRETPMLQQIANDQETQQRRG